MDIKVGNGIETNIMESVIMTTLDKIEEDDDGVKYQRYISKVITRSGDTYSFTDTAIAKITNGLLYVVDEEEQEMVFLNLADIETINWDYIQMEDKKIIQLEWD